METRLSRKGARRFLTTDDPAWFAARGTSLLGQPIVAERVHLPA
jgi:glutamate racemase